MKLFAIYLVFFKGYSIVRFSERQRIEAEHVCEYGACNDSLEFDYGHNGEWGEGNTPFEAVLDCYKKVKAHK